MLSATFLQYTAQCKIILVNQPSTQVWGQGGGGTPDFK